ncbi:MAG: hypothetical protein ACXACX_06500 [Candidatus Hodarchaeales archaeon]|jgi:hypothetical protein
MISKLLQKLLETIEKGDVTQFKDFLLYYKEMEFLILNDSEDFEKISDNKEKCYYLALSKLLTLLSYSIGTGDEIVIFDDFSKLINMSDEMGIFLEVKKIPFRFKIMAELHLDGMQKGLIGRVFVYIRFFNKYNLFEKEHPKYELEIINTIKKNDKALIANLKDLFGNASDSLIYYSCKIMPYNLLLSYKERVSFYLSNRDYVSGLSGRIGLNFLKTWTDYYSMYGLRVKNLSSIQQFIDNFEKNYDGSKKLLEFNIFYRTVYLGDDKDQEFHEVRKHLVAPENILKNKDKILDKEHYNFYSISMILSGGLGSGGEGFTYSTPKGEHIEICLDQDQTEVSSIPNFKQFLTRKFLNKLEEELTNLEIGKETRKKLGIFLTETLNTKDSESYNNKNLILTKISDFLNKIEELHNQNNFELEDLVNKIFNAVSIILSDIKHKDQFISWMNLVTEGKLKSAEIAKLITLNGKSHYDVLRERLFFQNELDWFFRDYADEIEELEKKFLRV